MPEVRKVDEIEGSARLPAALALVLRAFLDIAYDVEYFAVPVDRSQMSGQRWRGDSVVSRYI
ncbi:hypothetical protein E4U24_006320 [Claviceps purpurea]|nr:hypothetical protein E4U24_006320 [Claviceps purpurea]KAG6266025.1 hypothetical protein E4U47_006079 [Claviceps purpurea]